ncbi:hypothetical protein [Clostridium beijerinckii]|uniref:hypothetical protein n=1 Tax=Clostridium beijerinckii TaxID=1520 RepID=UPI00098C7672|nr:hypothetical protein [Clostridium beijerinckii]NRT77848.1 hypothetical protein [Clostridium beijerinckii]OOM36563.1 hypothetical protein CBEIJ_51050 [Clostridium beijerinckii]
MLMDYFVFNVNVTNENDINDLLKKMSVLKNTEPFVDEVVVNVKCNKILYGKLIDELKKCYFGTNVLLAQVNIYIDNIQDIKLLPNEVDKFLVPILCFDSTSNGIINTMKNLIHTCKEKYFAPIVSINIDNSNEYINSILTYNMIKAYFYDEEIKILHNFKDKDAKLIKEILKDTSYIEDTLNFLGYSDNSVLRVIKKCLREMEIGIEQVYEDTDRQIINTIDNKEIDLEIIHNNRKDLVRSSMDDYFKI